MIESLERYQEQNGLKIDGVAKPGGPTERAINNRLLGKPRGAGLLFDPPASISAPVGNGFENRRGDVSTVQRKLGALHYLPEDPFDRPHGFIDEPTTKAITRFQTDNGLTPDGWLEPDGETERALDEAVADIARGSGRKWLKFAERAASVGRASQSNKDDRAADEGGITLVKGPPVTVRPGPQPTSPGRPTQLPRRFGPPGLFEPVVPPSRPELRWSEPLPRDLEWTTPGPRPLPPFRSSVPRSKFELGPIGIDDVDRALRRPPVPDPDTTLTYLPELGSPSAIPILGARDGRRGRPETNQATNELTTAVNKACEEVMGKDATVTHYAGPGPSGNEPERRFPPKAKNYSYPDSTTEIDYKGFKIVFLGDTYTPKGDLSPNSAEQARFAKLDRNADQYDRVYCAPAETLDVWPGNRRRQAR